MIRIFLLDDHQPTSRLIQLYLDRSDIRDKVQRIVVARTLAETVKRVADERFDLVIADLNLPDATGLEVVRAITQVTTTPVVVLTGEDISGQHDVMKQAGASHVASKQDLSPEFLANLVMSEAIVSP